MSSSAVCWMNGAILPALEASVSVFDHGLLYGDGVFEGIRFYNQLPFRLTEHLNRLNDSARALALRMPCGPSALAAAVEQTVRAFSQPNGYLRLVITRGPGPLGLDPRGCTAPNLFIIADHLEMVRPEVRAQGAALIIAATRRLSPDGLDPRIKSLNYLNAILARIEANRAGADEALLLNAAGRVTEGTADNVFVARRGMLRTPPPIDGALNGITRSIVLELANELGIPAAETPLAPYDLYTADECFLTGTGAELIPVASVDGRVMSDCPGPVFRHIESAFRSLIDRESRIGG
ncbi:MAG: branched-chain-amino-acid transaminase [Gammaproteobacteria bacterium]|nr:branched-chain-amino-acid transaminase [Gammaproteobacteria bacterium]